MNGIGRVPRMGNAMECAKELKLLYVTNPSFPNQEHNGLIAAVKKASYLVSFSLFSLWKLTPGVN